MPQKRLRDSHGRRDGGLPTIGEDFFVMPHTLINRDPGVQSQREFLSTLGQSLREADAAVEQLRLQLACGVGVTQTLVALSCGRTTPIFSHDFRRVCSEILYQPQVNRAIVSVTITNPPSYS